MPFFTEDFSSGIFPPDGWTIVGDGAGNWLEATSNNAGGEAPEAMISWTPQFVGNSKLVTSEIATNGYSALLLEFKHYVNDYGGGYSVMVETTSDGATWNEVWVVEISADVGPETQYLLIDNDDVGSDNFQIAFTFDGDSFQLNQWYIDDVLLSEALSLDAGVTMVDMPLLLGTGMSVVPGAIVGNAGAEIATFDVVFEILNGGSSIYTETVTVTDLGGFEETSVAFPAWVAVEGTYVAQVTVDLSGDENPDNDMMSVDFEVMDGLIAKKPLYEEFTSSTCAPCVFANEAIEEVLGANPGEYSLIKYQMNWPGSGDPYYNVEGGVRRDYYGCIWVPDLYINSNQIEPAVSISQEIFDVYADDVTALEIDITEASIDENLEISISADLTPLNDYAAGLTAHIVVVEKLTVENVGTNGETEFHNVMMKMLPDANGTALDALSTGVSVSLSESYDMSLTFMETPNDLAVIVFVQDDTDKSIVQSAVLDVESSTATYTVEITIEDEEENPIEGAEVTLESNGIKTTNTAGIVLYNDVVPGTYAINVEAEGYYPNSGSVTVVDQDVSVTITLAVPQFYWFEMFDTEIPSDWTTHMTGSDFLYWYDGKVIFFRQSWTDNPVMLVTPAIEIEPADKIYFDLGEQGNILQDCAFGTVTDPSDPETFTELALFTPGVDWETFEYDLSNLNNTENDVYFAWKMTAPEISFFSFDNVILTAGGSSVFNVDIAVEDEGGNPIEGAEVTLEGIGTQTTDATGIALFSDVPPATYSIDVVAEGYLAGTGSVQVVNQNVSVTIVLEEELEYYWIETFDTEIPSDWTTHNTGSDFLYWYNGKVIFFRQSGTDNPIMLVTPAIDIAPANMIYFDMGEQGNIPQDCAFGTVTDPSDPETFTELALFTPGVDWETFEYDLSNLENTEDEVYFAWKMTAPEVCFYSFDNVILTEGSGGTELCVPEYNTGCEWGDGFTDFALAEIENYGSSCADLNGVGWSQYFDLGPAELTPGETYTVTMGSGYTLNFATVWIDWNDDLEFTEDEQVIFNEALPEAGELAYVDITIPVDAPTGMHVMRARTNFDGDCLDPCEEYFYGEAEDYMVLVGTGSELGKIQGFVRDAETNIAIDEAMISAVNAEDETYTTATPFGSHYQMMLTAGTYAVSCASDGYVTSVVENVEIVAGENVNHTFYLEPAKIVTGLGEDNTMQTKVFPNPAKDKFFIETPSGLDKIQMIDVAGQMIHEQTVSGNKAEISTSGFEPGIYFVKLISDDQIITRKLMIE